MDIFFDCPHCETNTVPVVESEEINMSVSEGCVVRCPDCNKQSTIWFNIDPLKEDKDGDTT